MWCMRQQQHVLVAPPAAAGAARSSGPRARSNGRCACAPARAGRSLRRALPPAAPERSHHREPERSRPAAITCTGSPCRRRRRWCAAPRAGARSRPGAAPSAATSSGPARRTATAMLYAGLARLELVEEPEPLLGERERQGRRPRHRRRGRAVERRARGSRRAASTTRAPGRATVGRLEQRAQRQLDAEGARAPATPPGWPAASGRRARRSRRRRPPARSPSTSAQMPASSSSTGVRGASPGPAAAAAGAGRARRSTLPFGVSGSASSGTKAAGTMCSGSRPGEPGPQRLPDRRSPRPRSRRPAASPRAGSSRASTAASRTSGWVRSTASISPGSMRKPRTFTWWSSAAEELQVAVRPPAHQVAGAVEPRSRLVPKGRDEALGGQLRAGPGSRGPGRRRRGTARPARRPAPAPAARSST